MSVSSDREQSTVRRWLSEVSATATAFESRWTLSALRRVDAELCRRLLEQRGLFDAACITGSAEDVDLQGAALCRGYGAAVRSMGVEPDDAYVLGVDLASGLKIAIGAQRAAVDRVRELHGDRVIWVTPDECARMLASVEAFKFVGAVKQFFPGAEIIDRYPDQPALNG